jgi:hypothetical protein
MDRSASPVTSEYNRGATPPQSPEQQFRERARISWIQRDALASRPDVWIGGYSPEYHFHRRRLEARKPVTIEGYNDSPVQRHKKEFPFH